MPLAVEACEARQRDPDGRVVLAEVALADVEALLREYDVSQLPVVKEEPPLMAAETDKASGDYSVLTRDDGKKQWALKGKPLYYWAKDAKPGDKTGDGFNKVWQVAKP